MLSSPAVLIRFDNVPHSLSVGRVQQRVFSSEVNRGCGQPQAAGCWGGSRQAAELQSIPAAAATGASFCVMMLL
jgi:hypothetical protein